MGHINPRALSDSVTHQLIDEIKTGKYKDALRLPPEDALAKEFNVSRSMMRECLTELERVGMLNRRKGIGTLINRRIINTPTRLDLISGVDYVFAEFGYETSSPYVSISKIKADEEVAANLEIPVGAPVILMERLVSANGKPAMFLNDFISVAMLPRDDYETEEVGTSIFQFLEEEAGITTNLFLTEIRSIALPEKAARLLEMEEGAPILYLSELGFDFQNNPVLYSQEYLADRVIHQMIVRKKI